MIYTREKNKLKAIKFCNEYYDLRKISFLYLNKQDIIQKIYKYDVKKQDFKGVGDRGIPPAKQKIEYETNKFCHFLDNIIKNNGKINTQYFYAKNKNFGRFYSQGNSIQNICGKIRNFLLEKNRLVDIDIVNCACSILICFIQIFPQLKNKCPILHKYVKNRQKIIDEVYHGDKDTCKNFINPNIYCDGEDKKRYLPDKNNIFENKFIQEIELIQDFFINFQDELPENNYMDSSRFYEIKNNILNHEKENIKGKLVNAIVTEIENNILHDVTEFYQLKTGLNIYALMYDGFITQEYHDKDEILKQMNSFIQNNYPYITFIYKPIQNDKTIINMPNDFKYDIHQIQKLVKMNFYNKPVYYKDLFQDKDNNIPVNLFNISFDYTYKNKTTKKYFSFQNIEQLQQKLINNNTYIFYQVITNDIRKLYFEFDFQPDIDLQRFLNIFINHINYELSTKINIKDIILFINHDFTQKGIHNLMITIPKYTIHYKQLKQLVKIMIHKYPECEYLNDNIYNKNYNLQLPNFVDIIENKFNYIPYEPDNELYNLNNYLIGYYYHNQILNYQISFDDYIHSIQDNNKEKVYTDTKQVIHNYINTLGDTEFFNKKNKQDWIITTRIIKKYNLYDFDKWNQFSIEYTKDKNLYNIDKNKTFYDTIDVNQVKSGYHLLIKILNKYLPYNLVFNESILTDRFFQFVKLHFNEIDIDYLKQNIKNNQNIYYLDINNNLFTFDSKRGFVSYKNKIVNYHYQDIINDYIQEDTIQYNKQVNQIEDTNETIQQFINTDKQNLFISSKWSTGKTHHIIQKLIEHYQSGIVLITESNTLNTKLKTDFQKFHFKSHQDNTKEELENNNTINVVSSIQSINKISKFNPKIIILDEYESVMNAFGNDITFNSAYTTSFKSFQILKSLINQSNKVIYLDADISKSKMDLIQQIDNKPIYSIKNTQNPFSQYQFFIHLDKNKMFQKILDNINNNQKIACGFGINQDAIILYNQIKQEYPNKNILLINSYGISIRSGFEEYTNRNIDEDGNNFKMEFISNLEDNIIKYNIDCWIYTPSIKTGISFNQEYFDNTFCYCTSNSIVSQEFLQMVFRVRRNKLKQINLSLSYYTHIKNNYDINTIYQQNKDFNQLNNDNNTRVDNLNNIIIQNLDDNFSLLQAINKKNEKDSFCSFNQQFIKLLKIHNLNFQFVFDEDYQSNLKDLLFNTKQNLMNNEILEFIETPLISIQEYKRIKDNLNTCSPNELLQYKKFHFFKILFNVNLEDIHNQIKNKIYSIDDLQETIQKQTDEYEKQLYIQYEINQDDEEEFNDYDITILKFIKQYKDKYYQQLTNEYLDKINKYEDELFRQMIFYDLNNNIEFIKKYYFKNKINNVKQIRKTHNYINNYKQKTNKKEINVININSNDKDRDIYKHYVLHRLFQVMNITIDGNNQLYTNRSLKELFILNKSFVDKELVNYVKYILNQEIKTLDITNKNNFKLIYKIINELLSMIDFKLKYRYNNHTTKDTDKLILIKGNNHIKYDKQIQLDNNGIFDKLKIVTQYKLKQDLIQIPLINEEDYEKIQKKTKYTKMDNLKMLKYLLNQEYMINITKKTIKPTDNFIGDNLDIISENEYNQLKNKDNLSETEKSKMNRYELNHYYYKIELENNNKQLEEINSIDVIPYDNVFKYQDYQSLEMLPSGSYKNKYIVNEIEVKEHSQSKTKCNYHYNLTTKNKIRLYKIKDNIYRPYNPKIKIYETHYEDISLFKEEIENNNLVDIKIPEILQKLNNELNSMKHLLYTPKYIINNNIQQLNLESCLIDD